MDSVTVWNITAVITAVITLGALIKLIYEIKRDKKVKQLKDKQ
ncbi:hypothetical protein [Helicobacter didelphidarum]|nr:hypothetical protein [Helicobacter didelphidarum]